MFRRVSSHICGKLLGEDDGTFENDNEFLFFSDWETTTYFIFRGLENDCGTRHLFFQAAGVLSRSRVDARTVPTHGAPAILRPTLGYTRG